MDASADPGVVASEVPRVPSPARLRECGASCPGCRLLNPPLLRGAKPAVSACRKMGRASVAVCFRPYSSGSCQFVECFRSLIGDPNIVPEMVGSLLPYYKDPETRHPNFRKVPCGT